MHPQPLFTSPGVKATPSIATLSASSPVVLSQPTMATPVTLVTDEQISNLGADHAKTYCEVNERILSSVRASQSDEMGQKLNEIVATSKRLDPQKLGKPGLLGSIVGMFSNVKERMLTEFDSVNGRMTTLVTEVQRSSDHFKNRVQDMEVLFQANEQAYHGFVACQHQAEQWLQQAEQHYETLASADISTTFEAQRQADVQAMISRLQKRIDDYIRMQSATKLLAGSIRLQQENSRALAEKFKEITITVIPTWQNVFSLYVMSLEQKKGAELATAMHEATDQAMRMQADMLRANTAAVASVRQRAVVSTEALMHAQQQLIGAVDDVHRINREGQERRQQDQQKLAQMDQELISRLTNQRK